MRTRLLFIIVLTFVSFSALAQKKKVEFTGTYEIPAWMSENVARGICLERAKSEAIANEFGEQLRSQSTVSLFNDQSSAHGESVSQEINSRIVPGIWLADEKGYPKYELHDGRMLTVTVKGWAAKHNNTSIPISVKVLRKGTDTSFEGTNFNDGDRMYVWMKSPVSGYVCIYLYDHQTERAYCLLPYSNASDGAYDIKANEDYVFFAPDKSKDKSEQVDELVMTSSNKVDYNMLYFLFSPNKFAHANIQYNEEVLNDNLITPRSMNYQDFMKWKADMLTADSQMEERSIMLQIKKK